MKIKMLLNEIKKVENSRFWATFLRFWMVLSASGLGRGERRGKGKGGGMG